MLLMAVVFVGNPAIFTAASAVFLLRLTLLSRFAAFRFSAYFSRYIHYFQSPTASVYVSFCVLAPIRVCHVVRAAIVCVRMAILPFPACYFAKVARLLRYPQFL